MRTFSRSLVSLLLFAAPLARAEEAAFPTAEEVPSGAAEDARPRIAEGTLAPAPAAPCPKVECPECPSPEAARDSDGVFRAFSVLASAEKTQRIAGGVSGLLLGGASLGIIGYLDSEGALSDATPWYVLGGVTMGSSLLALFLPSEVERMATSARAEDSGHSASEAEQFERSWARLAAERETQRKSGALLGAAIGAAGVGVGVAMLAGAFDMTPEDRKLYGTVIVGAASGVVIGSAVSYFVPSSMETSYAEYRAATSPVSASLGLVPASGGAAVGVLGSF